MNEYVENVLEDLEESKDAYIFFVMDTEKYLEFDDADLYGETYER